MTRAVTASGLVELEIGVVVPSFVSTPIYVAQRLGLLEREGIRLRERPFFATHAVTEALADGVVPLIMSSPDGAIANASGGGPLRVCAGFVNSPPLSMIAQKHYGSLAELRGARVGTTSLTEGTRHLIEQMLAANGLYYPRDYELVFAGAHPDRWRALQAGTIDAALQLVPFDYIAEAAGYPNLGAADTYVPQFAFCGVCVRADWAEENAPTVVGVLRALRAAVAWLYEHPDEAATILAEVVSADPDLARRACRAFVQKAMIPRDLKMSAAAFETTVAAMRHSGELPLDTDVPLDAVCDLRYLAQAAA